MEELVCAAGCTAFYGGEIRHHKGCPFYPESYTKMHEDLVAANNELIDEYNELLEEYEALKSKIQALFDCDQLSPNQYSKQYPEIKNQIKKLLC